MFEQERAIALLGIQRGWLSVKSKPLKIVPDNFKSRTNHTPQRRGNPVAKTNTYKAEFNRRKYHGVPIGPLKPAHHPSIEQSRQRQLRQQRECMARLRARRKSEPSTNPTNTRGGE